jgi:uncharacterized membrane protein YadS
MLMRVIILTYYISILLILTYSGKAFGVQIKRLSKSVFPKFSQGFIGVVWFLKDFGYSVYFGTSYWKYVRLKIC